MITVEWSTLQRTTIANALRFAAEQFAELKEDETYERLCGEIGDDVPGMVALADKLEDYSKALEVNPIDCGMIWAYYEEFSGHLLDSGDPDEEAEYNAGKAVADAIVTALNEMGKALDDEMDK